METVKTPQDLIQLFIDKLGVSIDEIETIDVAAHTMYNIHTKDSKQLIGPQGDNLRALNYLVRRFVERNEALQDKKFLVDVNGYQHVRIKDLEQKAKLLADRVRTFRSSAEMTPMNAYERMIIHAMFTDDPEVTTESDGYGKTRHVVLRYKTEGGAESIQNK